MASRGPAQVVRPETDKILKARSLASDGKVEDASKLLNDMIGSEKDADKRGLLRMSLAVIQFRASQDQAAEEQFNKALEDGLRIPDYAHYHLGVLRAKAGKSKEARESLEKTIESKAPKATETDARYQLAHLHLKDKNWKAASSQLEVLRKNVKNDDRYPEVLYYLIHTDKNSGRKSQSCKWARELYAKYPNHTLVQDWGSDLSKNKVEGQTLSCLADTKDLKLRVRRLWLGGNEEKAEKELRALKDETDEDGTSVVDSLLANHLISEGRLDEALKLLLKKFDSQKNRPAYQLLLAKASSAAGEYQSAVAAYQRAYELAPRGKYGPTALFQAAFTSYLMQDYDGATRRFEQLLKTAGGSKSARDARWHLAWIRYLRGDYQGAYDSLAQLTKAPVQKKKRRGRRSSGGASDAVASDRIQYWSAMSLLKMGKTEQAVPVFQNLAKDPSFGYYAMLSYYRLVSIPGSKLPPGVESRLGLRKAGDPNAATSEEELKEAAAQAAEEVQDELAAAQQEETTEEETPEEKEEAVAEAAQNAVETVLSEDKSFKDAGLSMRFERARDLALVGLEDAARRELREIEKRARSVNDRRLLMAEYANVRSFERSSYLGEVGFGAQRLRGGLKGEGRPLWEQAYPRAWDNAVVQASQRTSVPEELIWGIMRAESHFRQDAQSPVGALGLMQLMPFTGRKVASLMNINAFETRSLLDPETNIRLGSRYLQRLLEKFSGRIPLVAASYNAGPHRVHAWVRNFGSLDMDEFIEHIPFIETRNYTKRVVRNFQIYSLLYKGSGAQSMRWLIQPIDLKFNEPFPMKEVW
jgi:soluble lytic murein transglycosylase